MAEELPKQELLIKLLKMTTSDNDGESLTALRKANEFLKTAGWDWEKLVRGRITVIADPFQNLTEPRRNNGVGSPGHTVPKPPPPPSPPPPPPLRGSPSNPISQSPNRFAGFCHCCGIEAVTNAGFIFKVKPSDSTYKVICASCNTSAHVHAYAAPPRRQPRKKAVSDLA
jgi:hypothetical protein